MNKFKLANLSTHTFHLRKYMSNPKPDFHTIIQTSISSRTKHQRNISPNIDFS